MSASPYGVLLTLLLVTAAPLASQAAAPEARLTPMTDAELDSYRGGYAISPDLTFQFGAVVRTFEDGQLALETTLNLSQLGVSVQQTAGPGVTPATVLGNIGLAGATGGAFSTPGGTTFIQNVANGQLANILLNTDSNRTFTQQTDVTVVLPGFADVQSQILRNLTGFHLNLDASAATVRSIGH